MRILVGLAALFGGLAACQSRELTTSSTSQDTVIISAGSDFGSVQVGQSSAAHTYTINPSVGASSDIVNSITESCPDFSVAAAGLPADVYRTCEPNNCPGMEICEPEIRPDVVGPCITEDLQSYSFTATFTPTVAGPLSCVVTITLDAATTPTTRTITLTGTGVPPPVEIGVSPTSVAFGDVRTGTASTAATVDVRSLGGSALAVSAVTVPSGYVLTGPTAFSLAPGGDQALNLTCNPTVVGPTNGSMTIVSNDPANDTFAVPLTCNGVTSNLAIAPSPATIPATLVGEPQSIAIDLVNTGGASTTLTSVTIDGPGFTLTGAPTTPTPLAPMTGELAVTVGFAAAAHGPASGTLTVVTSDGTRTAQVTASALLATMSVTPDGAVDLGPVCAGSTASQAFSLIGNGDGPFAVQTLALGSDDESTGSGAVFTLDAPSLPAAVQASGANQVTFSVAVAPVAAGPLATTLTVTTNIPNGAPDVIDVTATGLAPGTTPTPAALDLGSNPLGSITIGQPILITNCGSAAVAFTSPRISGSDASEFAIVAQPTTSAIEANASATWLISMSAQTAGLKSADFAVDFADGTTTDVPLTGEGLSPDVGSGSDTGDTGEHNYYSCAAGDAGGLAPLALGWLFALSPRRRKRSRA